MNIVQSTQHITSTNHSILAGRPNLPPLVVCWATNNFRLFHILFIGPYYERYLGWWGLSDQQSFWVITLWDSLTHWGRVTHICVGKLTQIGSDNGLSPGRRQAIIWTNTGILLIGPLGTNFSEISIGIQTFSFNKCTWTCRLRNGVHFVSASMC